MRNRAVSLLLAVLLATWVVPVHAADGGEAGSPPVLPGPVGAAQPSPDAAASPETSPAPAVSPSPEPSADPSPGPSADSSADPSPGPNPSSGVDTGEGPRPGPSGDPAPTPPAGAVPSAAPAPSGAADTTGGETMAEASALDPTGRYIVLLRAGTDASKTRDRHAAKEGLKADRLFEKGLRGFSAKLTSVQRSALAQDPDVTAIVPDEIVTIAGQLVPTGVSRVGGRSSTIARINGADGPDGSPERVDADVAIVDTGVDPSHPDLNVAGGINCSTSDPNAWYDSNGHGTHVAGTVAALDNGIGVVGVAPGARIWAVRILNADGNGLLSWYVCGLDWIAAQRDPADPSRPLFEAVNMSVAKWGSDDHACGTVNNDILHQAICRLVASGVTVVAAAANDSGPASKRVPAAYDEVITVSALADTDGLPGGKGGNRCYSWGGYDKDDTFADFSNYGPDVDIIAPGKCIWSTYPGNRYVYLSGTSMAAPHVTGAAALYKSLRPWASPLDVKEALVALGTYGWSTGTDPDGHPDRLLDVSRIGPYGDFTVRIGSTETFVAPIGGSVSVPIDVDRTSTFVERVALSASGEGGLGLSFAPSTLIGLGATHATLDVRVPQTASPGSYGITVTGTEHGRLRQATLAITVLPMTRLAGPDRFGTAAAISAATFAPGVPVVYIATAYAFPDALAGASAAGTIKGPVLLAAATGPLHSATAAELRRLAPARIVILGGSGAISNAVATSLASYVPG
jgi:subtilisin